MVLARRDDAMGGQGRRKAHVARPDLPPASCRVSTKPPAFVPVSCGRLVAQTTKRCAKSSETVTPFPVTAKVKSTFIIELPTFGGSRAGEVRRLSSRRWVCEITCVDQLNPVRSSSDRCPDEVRVRG